MNVGTNGGSSYTRPGTVPTRSDTALVTSFGYTADNIQTLSIAGAPSGGSFTLTFGGNTTSGLAYNATASAVQTALAALTSIGSGNVAVYGASGGPYTIRFIGSKAGTFEAAITTHSFLTGGTSPTVTDVVSVPGGNCGMQASMTDPRGIVSKTDYDLLDRTVDTVAAFVDGVPSNADDQITAYTYDGIGDITSLTAIMPAGTASQTTAYIYGVGVSGGLYSNDLLAGIQYPDKSTGFASSSSANDISYAYNELGDVITKVDQNGSTHAYSYDTLGRMTLDAVTTLASGVDGTVKALGFSFDTGGRPYQDTSYGAANLATFAVSTLTHSGTTATATMGSNVYNVGDTVTVAGASPSAYNGTFKITAVNTASHTFNYTMLSTPGSNASGTITVTAGIINQDQFAYEGFGQVAKEYQNTTGAVNTGTTASVQYLYTEDANVNANISTATESGHTVTITTANAHHFSVGQTVTIAGVGVSGYNGTFTITAVGSSTTFTYTDATTSLSNSSSGTAGVPMNNDRQVGLVYPNGRVLDYLYGSTGYVLSGITFSGNVATAAMGSNVYSVGSIVTVTGATDPLYDGTFIVTAVNTTSHTFSYAMSGTPSASASGTALLATTGGTLDGSISRVSALMDHQGTSAGTHLEEYTYLGLVTIVTMNRPEANEKLTYKQVTGDTLHGSDGGDQYTGLDRFGRVVDQYWLNTASSPNAIDRFQYGYDRDGDVLYKKNLLSSSFSELYHTNSASSGDNNSAYDVLGRLTGMRRGTLSSSGHNGSGLDTVTTLNSTSGITGNSKSWSLNAVGDWSSVTTDGTATSHTNNAQNEITAVGATSQTYDNNGNVLTDSAGNTLTYDAWNRLMTSSNQSLHMQYDALGNWVHEVYASGTNEFYYDTANRNLETLSAGGLYVQNAWGLAYVNEFILRDKNADNNNSTGDYGLTGSHLEQRQYANQDANWNTTSLYQVNGTPAVVERIIYDAYGSPTTLTAAWANFPTQTYYFRFLFQGTYWLQEANVQMMGARDMDYTTGSWVEKDHWGYVDGMSSYQFVRSNPVGIVDPAGEAGYPARVNGDDYSKDTYRPQSWTDAKAFYAPKYNLDPNDPKQLQDAYDHNKDFAGDVNGYVPFVDWWYDGNVGWNQDGRGGKWEPHPIVCRPAEPPMCMAPVPPIWKIPGARAVIPKALVELYKARDKVLSTMNNLEKGSPEWMEGFELLQEIYKSIDNFPR